MIGPKFYGLSGALQDAILEHEILHDTIDRLLGFQFSSDLVIADKLSLDLSTIKDPSAAITNFLQNNCDAALTKH